MRQIKILYSYDCPEEAITKIEFKSIAAFLKDKRGRFFKELLLSEGSEVIDQLTLDLSYPATIVIKIIDEKRGN